MPNKFSNIRKLSKGEQEELFIRFAKCLASLKSSIEAGNFIRDLFSEQEVLILARRLQIADLLIQNFTYEQIRSVMNVGPNTIAKVQLWLNMHGEGFKVVLERNKNKVSDSGSPASQTWRALKKKAPMYFWPEIVLEEIIKSATKRERDRLRNIIVEMKDKTKLSKSLQKFL